MYTASGLCTGHVGPIESQPKICRCPVFGSNVNQTSFFLPVYKIPSELRHGDEATNWGMVKGSFFKGSRFPPRTYRDPSLGSGKNNGMMASLVFDGTLTTGSEM